jgi:predicted AlkP superfamily phosphohydrolase/phosphomutase
MENDDYTAPKELKKDLLTNHGWRIAPIGDIETNPARFIKDVHRLIDMRFSLAENYVDKAGSVQVSIFFIDDVQHYFWRQMKEGVGNYKDAIESLWNHIDDRIGKLRKKAGHDHNIFIFSDHGFTDLKGAFYINEWLSGRYLEKKPIVRTQKRSSTERLVALVHWLHLTALLRRLTSEKRRRRLQDSTINEELERRHFFDWNRTKVYASGEGPVYINRTIVSDETEYETLRDQLKEDLEGLIHPETEEKVIKKVYKREEIYHGPHVGIAPDLIILPELGYEIVATVTKDSHIWASLDMHHNKWAGVHRMEGILIMNGPAFKKGLKIDNARIYDLCPTILALKGLPIPNDIDGRVLIEALKEPNKYKDIEQMEVEDVLAQDHTFTEEEEMALEKRLEGLGYM